jgi:hypothetical protein
VIFSPIQKKKKKQQNGVETKIWSGKKSKIMKCVWR